METVHRLLPDLNLEIQGTDRHYLIDPQPEVIALYEKLGFTPVGRRKDFYRDPVEDALLMTRFF